ncbi:MAG: hypothetical protein ACI4XE_00725 [Acutalibacteraceae bacterium]
MKKLLISFAVFYVIFLTVICTFQIPYSIVTKKTDTIMQLCKDNEKSVADFYNALINAPDLKPGRSYRLVIRDNKVILQTFEELTDIVDTEKDVSGQYMKYWSENEWLREDDEVYVENFAGNEYIEPGSSIMLKYCFTQKLYNLERILRIYYGDETAFLETDYYSSTGEHSYHYLTDSKKLCYDVDTYWLNEKEVRLGVSS